MSDLGKKDRIRAVLDGDVPDRTPVSFYQHHHAKETDPRTLARHLAEMNRKYDWDFIKVQSRYSLYAEAWGCRFRFHDSAPPEFEEYVVHEAKDLAALEPVSMAKSPFADHILVCRLLRKEFNDAVPVVQTTLSPLAVATRLAGGAPRDASEPNRILKYMEEDADGLHQALSVITETLAEYARSSIRAGADGLFMTTSVWATHNTVSEDQYEEFGKPYDVKVFEAAADEGGWLNILHICKDHIMFALADEYPIAVVNWDTWADGNPTMQEALLRSDKVLWGGIDQKTIGLHDGPPETISRGIRSQLEHIQRTLEMSGGTRVIIGPGCVIPPEVPASRLDRVMQMIQDSEA
jgi:uroporphyrinogen decarboxylase